MRRAIVRLWLWLMGEACCLALTASLASSTVYYVSPTGGTDAAHDGSNWTDAKAKTLAWFNANCAAGDVAMLKGGTYTDPVKPARHGTSVNRIRYYGRAFDPESVVVNGIWFGPGSGSEASSRGSYATARWMRSSAAIQGCTYVSGLFAVNDSLVSVRSSAQNDVELGLRSQRSVFDSLTISGVMNNATQANTNTNFISISGQRQSGASGSCVNANGCWNDGATNNRLTNSTFTCTVTAAVGGGHCLLYSVSGYNFTGGNTYNITYNGTGGYFFGQESYESYFNVDSANVWNVVVNTTTGGTHSVVARRDSSQSNTIKNSRFIVTGAGTMDFSQYTTAGTYGQTSTDNTFSDNLVRINTPTGYQASYAFGWSSGCTREMFEFNDIAVNSSTFAVLGGMAANFGSQDQTTAINGSIFRHNTLRTGAPTVIDFRGLAPTTAASRLVANACYGAAANGAGTETVKVRTGGVSVECDSAGLFFNPTGTAARAIASGATNTLAGTAGAPGAGGAYGGSGAIWGSPRFTDSTYATFNGVPLTGSNAVNVAFTNGYAGAYGTAVSNPAHTITSSSGANGTLSPLGAVTVADGDNQAFSIIPASHYHVASASVDAVSQGAITSYGFTNVTADHALSATFALDQYTITASTGAGGSVSPTGAMIVNYGASQAYTITPDGGKVLVELDIDGEPDPNLTNPYTFTNVTVPHYIQAFFGDAPPTTYSITASAGVGGTIAPLGPTAVSPGGSQAYTITAYSGYHVSNVLVDGGPVGAVTGYTFTNVQANHLIAAAFAPDDITVVAILKQRGSPRTRTRNR